MSSYQQNPYETGPAGGDNHGYGQANPYQENYELQSQPYPGGATTQSHRPVMTQKEFLDRVSELRSDIRSLTSDIDHIGQLHQRTLGSTDGAAKDQLEAYVTQTQVRNTAIKDGIKGLERDLSLTTDSSRTTKSTQLQSIKTFFRSELEKYQAIESEYRQKYREQISRQYRIVNPDASEDEIRQAADANWGDEGVFQTAIKTNRTGHATSLLGNVRARHYELQRIEQTLVELSMLYQELATQIEQQDATVTATEDISSNVRQDIEQGTKQVGTAVEHAKRARKLKWWCFGICVAIIIIALIIGLAVAGANGAFKKG